MFSRRLLGIGFIVGVGLIVAVAYGVVVLADNSWLTYHWERSSNPVQLTLGDNFKTGAWDGHFTAAVADWNESTVLELTKVAGGTSPRKCKAATGKIEVCAERYGNTGWLGLAQIWISGDHITKAIAKMNDFYFVSGGSYDTPAWRALVMCQEIGHDFGLGRQDGATDSCMGSGQQPNDHDYAQLETIYSQLDEGGGSNEDPPPPCKGGPKKCGGGALAQPSPPAFDMELPNSGQWGRAIAVSRDGGKTLFVQDFGNGYLVYTHVTWTLEVAETLAARR